MANKQELLGLCLDRMNPTKLDFSASDADTVIRNMFKEMIGTDKIDRKIFRRHAIDIFEIIEEVVDQTIVDSEGRKNAFFRQFVEEKSLANGDTNSFYIPNNSELRVARISRGNWTLERQRIDQGKDITIGMSTYGIKVYTEFVSFMAGRTDFPALIAKLVEAVEKFVNQLAYDSFVSTLSGLPTIFRHNGAYDADKISNVISSVETSNGEVAYLIGTKKGLQKIQATTIAGSGLSDRMKEEINSNGFLREWNGTICMELPQGFKAGSLVKNVAGTDIPDFIFDDNQLFVVTGNEKPVKFYYEGSEMTNEKTQGTENEDQTLEYTLLTNIGVGIAFNKLFGTIVLA